jgi:hypothetical protein
VSAPPQYPESIEPSKPRWRRWWGALLLLVSLQSVVLLTLMPNEQPRLELWLWSAVLPLCWALALALRFLTWQIGMFGHATYRRAQDAATHHWWQWRCLRLPVAEVLLLGPAGDEQTHYRHLMADAPPPEPLIPVGAKQPMLRCPLSLSETNARGSSLARHLARQCLAHPGLGDCWPQLRAVAWAGDDCSYKAFMQTLAHGGVKPIAETFLPMRDLADLDDLFDAFHREYRNERDWLLCAGVVSVESAEGTETPGEAAFLWRISRHGQQALHRGEYLMKEAAEVPSTLCARLQRSAGLDAPPPTCLSLDKASQEAFVEGGWLAGEHLLAGQWGVLTNLAPFIGMSLALLEVGESGQACGWLSQDGNKRLAIGMAVPYGDS